MDLTALRTQVMFKSLLYALENKITSFSDINKFYINNSIIFFDEILSSLDKIDYKSIDVSARSYSFVPNLLEIVSCTDDKENKINEDSIKKFKTYITWIKDKLQIYQAKPAYFFQTNDAEKIKKLVSNFVNIFTEDPDYIENEVKFTAKMVYA